ncbi:Terminase small subunit [compost metagenome]
MALTQKQEAFCLAYMETGNASEAYRRCYSAGGMKPESVNREAKALTDNPKIAARLSELRAPVVEASQMTLESHLQRLADLSDKAEKAEKYAAAVAAEIARGKASGLYVEKTEITGANGGPVDMNWTVEFIKPAR